MIGSRFGSNVGDHLAPPPATPNPAITWWESDEIKRDFSTQRRKETQKINGVDDEFQGLHWPAEDLILQSSRLEKLPVSPLNHAPRTMRQHRRRRAKTVNAWLGSLTREHLGVGIDGIGGMIGGIDRGILPNKHLQAINGTRGAVLPSPVQCLG
ncbi:hypothetical protein K438DRAFT_1774757 [Mycena galopus ATCC 62051]|nr:hypothetical protein K438DRAFT_1774757 [Mycena galopus ATCC 62051]